MYRTVAQLDSVMGLLAAFFPQLCTRVELPNRSHEGRQIYALRMRAGSGSNRRGVLLVGGMHARELMNPDAIVELQLDLVRCYLNETGLTIGNQSWSAMDIKVLLEALDIWMLPCANPDGREYVMSVDDMWRQNRRDNPGTACDGVDVNRNFDFVWGVPTSTTSCSPCQETFVGPNAFSEPESRNVKHLCDTQRIDVFCDIHSFSELVLYPWGHTSTQTTDPTQRFTNLTITPCQPLTPPNHQEYMLPRDLLRFQTVARRVVDTIRGVRNRNYTPQSIRALYATSGTSTDYVYSRHIANPALRKTYGFSFETGPFDTNTANSFHPLDPTFIKRDAKAGMLSLMQQSVCAIEFIGAMFLSRTTQVQTLRGVRDEVLATTQAGREWISLFERIQTPLLGEVLADPSLTKQAIGLLEKGAKLLDSDEAVVSVRDMERAVALVDAFADRVSLAALRRDLATVRKQLKKAGGKSVRKVLEDVLRTRPHANTKAARPPRKRAQPTTSRRSESGGAKRKGPAKGRKR